MKKRESFNTRWGFILACIGSAVGMGNIWMFPTRVSLYGGGAFLIPYFIFVALIGFTGVIGEMTFGRATRSGPIDAFGIACERKEKRKEPAWQEVHAVLCAFLEPIWKNITEDKIFFGDWMPQLQRYFD